MVIKTRRRKNQGQSAGETEANRGLTGVVAKVNCPSEAHGLKEALCKRLEHCGAVIAERMRRDVTHVVFAKHGEGDSEFRLEKLRASIVWEELCQKKQSRACCEYSVGRRVSQARVESG